MAQWDPSVGMGFITESIRDGASATSALSTFRENGGSIRNDTWYKLYGEARAALGNRDVLAGIDPSAMPLDEHFTTWSNLKAEDKLYQVEILAKDNVTGDIIRVPYSVMTDNIMTPQQGIDEAISATEGNLDRYNQTIMGGVLVGLYNGGS